jgi:hypothetical protein
MTDTGIVQKFSSLSVHQILSQSAYRRVHKR